METQQQRLDNDAEPWADNRMNSCGNSGHDINQEKCFWALCIARPLLPTLDHLLFRPSFFTAYLIHDPVSPTSIMRSFRTLAVLIVSLSFLVAVCVQGKKKKKTTLIRDRKWSVAGGDFYFWAYTFNQLSWPDTPLSMEEFGQNIVEIMWTNKPNNMSAAICIQGSWFVKNYDLISATMRTSYFKKTWFGFTTCEVRK